MKRTQILFILIFLVPGVTSAQVDSKAIHINNEAYKLLNQGKYNEAINGFNNAIKVDSSYYLFYQNRAFAYSELKNDSFAIKDYKQAIQLNPDIANMYYSLANIYQRKELYDFAYDNYTLAINAAVKNNDKSNLYIYYFNRGNNLLETEKYKESILDFDSTEKANPDFNDLYQNRGIAKYKINKMEEACLDWYMASILNYPDAKKYLDENCNSIDLKKFKIHPEFEGGKMGLRRHVASNVIYPAHSREDGEQGNVYLRFQVNKNGSISIINAYSFTHQDLIIEAIKAVLSTKGKWTPGSINGKKVNVLYSIPVSFKIGVGDDDKSNKEKAYKYLEEGKYGQAKTFLHNYLRWNFDTTVVKDYIKIKYLLNDTADIEYYKYMIGKSDINPDYLKKFSKHIRTNNGFPLYFSTKPPNKPNEIKTLYYNDKFELSNKEDALFYRLATWNPNISFFDSTFSDYNKNNNLIHTGSYCKGYKDGIFKIFNYETSLLLAEGKYNKNKMYGLWKFYYKTGQLKDEVVIIGNEFKIINHYSENEDILVKTGIGKWTYKIESYDGKNDMYVSGNLVNGMKDGLWTIRNEEKNVIEEQYKNGKFKNGKYYEKKKAIKTSEPIITSWIFINTPLERMGSLLVFDDMIKKFYPFIKFQK